MELEQSLRFFCELLSARILTVFVFKEPRAPDSVLVGQPNLTTAQRANPLASRLHAVRIEKGLGA